MCISNGMPTKESLAAIRAAAVNGMRRWLRIPDTPATDSTLDKNRLLNDLSLAAEHVHSIRCLVEIARQRQQPIPSAALTNLSLVSKQLDEICVRIAR
jgi:hypothetical protein